MKSVLCCPSLVINKLSDSELVTRSLYYDNRYSDKLWKKELV